MYLNKTKKAILAISFLVSTQCISALGTQLAVLEGFSQKMDALKDSFSALSPAVRYTTYAGTAAMTGLAIYGLDYYRDSRNWGHTLSRSLESSNWLSRWKTKRAVNNLLKTEIAVDSNPECAGQDAGFYHRAEIVVGWVFDEFADTKKRIERSGRLEGQLCPYDSRYDYIRLYRHLT